MTVFRGTGMKMMLTLESLTSQCDLCLADLCQGGELEWGTKQKLGECKNPRDILNAILGDKYY